MYKEKIASRKKEEKYKKRVCGHLNLAEKEHKEFLEKVNESGWNKSTYIRMMCLQKGRTPKEQQREVIELADLQYTLNETLVCLKKIVRLSEEKGSLASDVEKIIRATETTIKEVSTTFLQRRKKI